MPAGPSLLAPWRLPVNAVCVRVNSSVSVLVSSDYWNKNRLGGFHNRNVFVTLLKAGKSRIKRLADWVPSEGLVVGM